jgi:hypothetical protein
MDKHNGTREFLQEIFPDWQNRAAFAGNTLKGGWYETRDLQKLDPAGDCYVSIGAFAPGAKRRDGALEVVFLVIDDVGEKVPEAAVIKGLGLRPSFSILSSAVSQQWVYKLSAPIPVEEWPGFFGGIKKLIGAASLDGPEAVHVFRLPMGVYSNQKKPERHGFKPHIGEHNPATVLDVDLIAPFHDKITVDGPAPEGAGKKLSREVLRELVAMIPNTGEVDNRNPWIGVAAGIKAQCENDTDGFEIWDEWCQTWLGDGKNSYDPDETWKAWESLKDGKIKAEGGKLRARAEAAEPGRFAQWKAKVVFDDEVVPPLGPTKPATAGITATPFKWVDLSKTRPRDWLYGDILLRKFVSMTVAPGGVGKSSLVAVETLAQVTGKSLLGEDASEELRVWLWNLEDPYEETQKRLLAAAKHYGIGEANIGDRLYVDSGRDQRLVIAEVRGGTAMIVRPVVSALVSQIQLRKIDVVVIDPFVSCHGVPENDNMAQDMVVKEWGRVAEEGNCAVHLVDHTSKAGSKEVVTDSSRGAKAKTDAARVVRVVNRMTDTDSKAYGIVEPWRYFNTFNDKANMAPPKSRRDWFCMKSVWAGNGGGAAQAFSVGAAAVPVQGDSIGVAVKWTPPDAQAMATGDAFVKVAKVMGTKSWNAAPQSKNWVGNAVAQGLQMSASVISDREAIKAIIKRWISDGLLRELTQMDKHRNPTKYIELAQTF